MKKVAGSLKLLCEAGKASPAPPIGPALGQKGVNIMEFCKAFNADTQKVEQGMPIPTVITVYTDRSFSFTTKSPPASFLIKKAAGVDKGNGEVGRTDNIGSISMQNLREIAEVKKADLNANDVDAACRILAGTARSMGISISD